MTFWLTSDEHADHRNILTLCDRPFKDLDHMREELVRRHNALVQPGDTVYHLGDLCFNPMNVPKYLERLHGEHYLIAGNHDKVWKHRDKWLAFYERSGLKGVCEEAIWKIAGQNVRLCHFPYRGVEAEKYHTRRPEDHGHWLIHGHRHSRPDSRIRGKQIDVGVDAWDFKPVSLEQVKEIIRAGTI